MKTKKCEALWYGLSRSRAADTNVSHLNYYWQVVEISFRFLHNAEHSLLYLLCLFSSTWKERIREVLFNCSYLAFFPIKFS